MTDPRAALLASSTAATSSRAARCDRLTRHAAYARRTHGGHVSGVSL